ncbi:MAG: hypothetical protein ABSG25_09485 [Bryobacteraceae bacterium]
MSIRLAYIYVQCLFGVELCLFASSVLVHVCILGGAAGPFAELGKLLFYCGLFAMVPAAGLAKEKNVWHNEFRECPKWLQVSTLVVTIYGFVVVAAQTILFSEGQPLDSMPLLASAVPLFLDSIPLCIFYSLLWASPVSGAEIIRRVRVSLVAAAVCVAIFTAAHLGYLPHHSTR